MKRFGWTFGLITALLVTYAVAGTLAVQITRGATQQAQAVTPPDAPAGTIVMYASATAPDGWLLLDGSTFSGTQYPDLAALLGSTTLPDFRGRFVRGWSTNASVDPSGPRAAFSLQGEAFKSHKHSGGGGGTDQCWGFALGALCEYLPNQGSWRFGLTPAGTSAWFGGTLAAGGDETRPVNIAAVYIIKATPQTTGLTAAEVDARIAAALASQSPSPAPTVTVTATPTGTATPTPTPTDTATPTPTVTP